MDSGPTYLLITALCVVGVLASFIIFKESDNPNITVIFSTIVTIVSFAYGYTVYKEAKNATPTS